MTGVAFAAATLLTLGTAWDEVPAKLRDFAVPAATRAGQTFKVTYKMEIKILEYAAK